MARPHRPVLTLGRILPIGLLAALAAVQIGMEPTQAAQGPQSGQGLQLAADGAGPSTAPRMRRAVTRVPVSATPVRRPRGYLLASVRRGRAVTLHSRAGGPASGRLGPTTEFGSHQVLSVVRRKGRWLGVTTAARPNGKLAWVDRRAGAVTVSRTRLSLQADLSKRRLELRSGRRVLKRLTVTIGRPGSPTPTGRFAVTDKLSGPRFGPYYGCCVLALTAHQPNTPTGWRGGNRMAIHGTSSPGTIGQAVSAGCLRAADGDLQVLMRRVPLGTPVFIHA